jgi:hypothetical protein
MKDSSYWFWAWIVILTKKKVCDPSKQAEMEVWKNLTLFRAGSAEEAYNLAIEHGKSEEGDCRGTLRLNGEDARSEFYGILDMGVVHDEISSGCEIYWESNIVRQTNELPALRKRIDLITDVANELRPLLLSQPE